ncbi:MAG: prolyl oligopeptidase family serine peptidase [Terriglobales bacterium]
MRNLRLVIGVVLLFAAWPAAAEKVTIDDLMRVRSVSDVRISPDGKRVAYVVSTPSLDTASHEPTLYVVSTSGGPPLRFTYSTRIFNQPVPTPVLRWSPDGSLISFLGFVGDNPQVMAMSASGGEAYPITSMKDGIATYEWSPDGKKIAFLTPDPLTEDELKRRKDKSYYIQVDRSNRIPRIWVQDVPSGTPKAISPVGQTIVDFSWAPDGQSIIYSGSKEFGFNAQYRSAIYLLPLSGGEPRLILDRPGMDRLPRYSPDGKLIAFISSGGYDGMISAKDLYVMAASGKPDTIRRLSEEAWMMEYVWAPDSRSIFFLTGEQTHGTGAQMFEQPVMRVPATGGRPERITDGPVVAYSVSVSRDGTQLAYRQVESRTAGDVYTISLPQRRATRLVEINPELRQFELGELKAVSWKSFDGAEIWGLLLTPPGYKLGARVPLVVYCHGGPIGGFTYGLFPQFAHVVGQVDPYPVEAMASAGMAILFPMPRGGSGYGVAGFRAILKSWGDVDYKDIMAGVDAMLERGIADPDRLGVMGGSYGGFMTNWIVTQTSRFKAASSACSLSDLPQMYYISDAGDFMIEYFGLPWEANELLIKHSPITHVRNVNTPLLIQHGENDMRVPVGQAKEFYRALKALNKTVELDIYPRGGHVNFEPPLEREYWRRNLHWFTRWLGSGTATTATGSAAN